jgi:hypothetical protein
MHTMSQQRLMRVAAIGLLLYSVLGLCTTVALVVIGASTFAQLERLHASLDLQRVALVETLRTAADTLGDSARATNEFQRSIDSAGRSADSASTLAGDTAVTFRELATAMQVQILGLQPLISLAPDFDRGGEQLARLATELAGMRDGLSQNARDVQLVGTDLARLESRLDAIADSLDEPGLLSLGLDNLLPFKIAFYGVCGLVLLQSLVSLIVGIALWKPARTATTSDEAALDRAQR